jgi:hypothetical protein
MKFNAHGTVLNLGDALVSPTYTAIAQVETFDGPELSRGGVEAPAHDDTDMVEVIAEALYRMGEISGTLLYDPANATHDGTTGLVALVESGDERPFQFIFSDTGSTQWDVQGFCARFNPTGMDANSGLMRADFAIRPTQSPTLA